MVSATSQGVVHLNPCDNICVATRDLVRGTRLHCNGTDFTLADDIRLGHKIALQQIGVGKAAVKYGQTIGFASENIAPGAWVHTHNLTTGLFDRDYAAASEIPPPIPPIGRTFQGYRRPDGKAGTRNYIAVISTVNCSASVSKYVARPVRRRSASKIIPTSTAWWRSPTAAAAACNSAARHQMLNRVLGGIARHPNIGGYLLIGLGCEQARWATCSTISSWCRSAARASRQRPPVLSCRTSGGTAKTIEGAASMVEQCCRE